MTGEPQQPGRAADFSAVLDRYTLLRIRREEYTAPRELPEGYAYVEAPSLDVQRTLLEPEFGERWQVPAEGRLHGSRPDGVVFVAFEGEPVGVVYLTDGNDFAVPGYAQAHYAAVRSEHRGRQLFSAMFAELLRRAEAWGHEGFVFIIDRAHHAEMYQRWGARVLATRPKGDPSAPWEGDLPADFIQPTAPRRGRWERARRRVRRLGFRAD